MPLSFSTTLSASATVVDVADVSPSTIFNSAAVASTAASFVKSACTNPDTPSSKFNSEALAVTPSKIFSSAAVEVTAVPFIASLSVTTLNVPLSSIQQLLSHLSVER